MRWRAGLIFGFRLSTVPVIFRNTKTLVSFRAVWAVAIFASAARAATPTPPARWRVDRLAPTPGPLSVASAVQQSIAERVGLGHYPVSDVVREAQGAAPRIQVLFIHASEGDRVAGKPPSGRTLLTSGAPQWFGPAEDAAVFAAVYHLVFAHEPGADELRAALPRLANLTLLGGGMVPLPDRSSLDRGAGDSWQWRGEFAAGTNRIAVTVVRERETAAGFTIKREPLSPGPVVAVAPEPWFRLEMWTIDRAPAWQPTKRYAVRLALAALRPDPVRNYTLAVELLGDPDPGAQAQGLRLLKDTAATGYLDAQKLLARIETGELHPASDREFARPER